jgi:hypothetical protein
MVLNGAIQIGAAPQDNHVPAERTIDARRMLDTLNLHAASRGWG